MDALNALVLRSFLYILDTLYTFLRYRALHSRALQEMKFRDCFTVINIYVIKSKKLEELADIREESWKPEASNHLDPKRPVCVLSPGLAAVSVVSLAGSTCPAHFPICLGCRET